MHYALLTLLLGNVAIYCSQVQHALLPIDLQSIPEACRLLAEQLPSLVTFPGDHKYEVQESLYWSLDQARQRPACRITPETVHDVAEAIGVLRTTKSSFAIKSGGHSSVVNASNVDDGITIDLAKLSSVKITSDRKSVFVGPGAQWRSVYHQLGPQNLGINGAAAGTVGVGGYLLGGGLSTFSGTHGWACDAIQAFEIVLANASIIEATTTKHEDLFRALKGGGSSFGIVTRLRLDVFPFAFFHTGFVTYAWSSLLQVMQALESFNENAHLDPVSSTALSIAFDPAQGNPTINIKLARAGKTLDSPILTPFFRIPYLFASRQQMKQVQLAELVDINNPSGFSQYKSTFTIKNDASLATCITQVFMSRCSQSFRSSPDPALRVGFMLQPLTAEHLSVGRHRGGGNSMGLHESDSLLLIFIEARWSLQTCSNLYRTIIDDLVQTFEHEAAERDLHHPFKYLNYASKDQDVFASYGQSEKERLRHIRDQYDRKGFWEKGLALPFKL